jgi:hypothetical protein
MTTNVQVTRVNSNSPAEGKLSVGDIIISCNDTPIVTLPDFRAAVEATPEDHPIVLKVQRGAKLFEYTFDRGALGVELATVKLDASPNSTKRDSPSRTNLDAQPVATREWLAQKKGISPSGGYALARSIAKFVRFVGWATFALGSLVFLAAIVALFSGDPDVGVISGAVGIVIIMQGLVVVLVSYGLEGVFDTADNTAQIVYGMRQIVNNLPTKREEDGR